MSDGSEALQFKRQFGGDRDQLERLLPERRVGHIEGASRAARKVLRVLPRRILRW